MDNIVKNKLNAYTQSKNALQTLHRKQTWVLEAFWYQMYEVEYITNF